MMETLQQYFNEAWDLLREGFNNVNAVKGLIIALVAAFMLPSWKKLWTIVLGAVVVHEIASVLIPVVANHAAFRLPPLVSIAFWRHALGLYAGYAVVIAAFFFVKKSMLSGASSAPKHG